MANLKNKSSSSHVLAVLCYKDKILLSNPEGLTLHSLRELDLPKLGDYASRSPFISLELGYKKDIIIATALDLVSVIKIDDLK